MLVLGLTLFLFFFGFFLSFLFSSGDRNFSIHISYSGVKISLHTDFQLPRLLGFRNASFRLNPIFLYFFGGGIGDPIFGFIFLLVGLK